MATKLYVGNLPWSVTNDDLGNIMTELGLQYASAEVVYDRETDRSRGFAFVHFDSDEAADLARRALSGYEVKGRVLVVDEATARQQDRDRGRRGGGGGGGYRGGGRGGRERRGYRGEGERDDF